MKKISIIILIFIFCISIKPTNNSLRLHIAISPLDEQNKKLNQQEILDYLNKYFKDIPKKSTSGSLIKVELNSINNDDRQNLTNFPTLFPMALLYEIATTAPKAICINGCTVTLIRNQHMINDELFIRALQKTITKTKPSKRIKNARKCRLKAINENDENNEYSSWISPEEEKEIKFTNYLIGPNNEVISDNPPNKRPRI